MGTRNASRQGQPAADPPDNERLLSAAVASVADGVLITSAEHDWPEPEIVFVNDAMCRISGYTAEELIGRAPRILLGEQPEAATMARLRQELSAGNAFRCELTSYRKDGTPRHTELCVTPLLDSGGRRTHFVAIHRDVTETQQLARALRDSEAVVRSIYASPVANIATVDADGRIVSVNGTWEQFARENGGPDTHVGANYLAVCRTAREAGDECAGEALRGLKEVMHGTRQVFSLEYPCHSPTEERWYQMTVTPAKSIRGGAVVAHFSITGRKQAEEALRREHELNERIIDTAQNIILLLDPDGRIVRFNPFTEQLTGWRLDEVRGHDWFDTFLPERNRNRIRSLFECAIGGQRTQGNVNPIVTRDGQERAIEWHDAPLTSSDGELLGLVCIGHDVTDAKWAERALRESERRLHERFTELEHIYRMSPVGLCFLDRELRYVRINDALAGLNGLPVEQHIGRRLREILPDIADTVEPMYRRVLDSGKPELNLEVNRPDTTDPLKVGNYLVSHYPVTRDDGTVIGVSTVVQDITERKQAEMQLRASQERLELAQAAARMGCFDWDFQMDAAHCTPEYFRVYGLEPSDETPSFEAWKQRLHPEDREGAAGRALRAAEAGGPYNDEFRVVWPDGSVHWLAVRGEVSRDESGEPLRMLGVNFDVTERKHAEEALRKSEEQMRVILNTASDAIITIDRQGIIDSVNPATENMFGYSRDELVGRDVRILMPSPYREDHAEYLDRYLKTGEARVIGSGRELTGRKKDGKLFSIDLSVSEVNQLGLFTGIVRDATERKQLEARLLTIVTEEQRRIGQELHDRVGQQLLALWLTANTLVQTLKDQIPPGQVARATKLTEGLKMALSEIRALSKGLVPVEVDEEGLMSALSVLAGEISELHGIRCRFHCRRAVRVEDSETATHLFRIAQEAVTNAVKHAQPHEIGIKLDATDDVMTLTVQDDGVGIPAGDERTGGIGLKIMRHRASLVGGRFTVEPLKHGGTSLTCTVPRRRRP